MSEYNNVPKIRFKGYTDAWEQRKFDEMADYKKGPFGSALKKDIFVPKSSSSVKVYEQQNAINKNWKLERYFITNEYFNKLKAFETHAGDIIVSCAGTIGEMYELPSNSEPGVINQALMRVRVNESIINKKMYQTVFLNMIDDFSREHSNGSAMKNIPPFSDLKPMTALIPKKEEQLKISSLFENIDNLITLHQRKLEKLKNIPEIRFKGFTDVWEQRKLANLINEYKETVTSDCTLPVLTSSKVDGVVLQEEHFGRKQNHDITGYNILPYGYCTYRNRSDGIDFTFNINKCCKMGIISKFYPVFYGNKNNINLISIILNNSKEVAREIGYTCSGTGQKVLSFLDLQKMNIIIANRSEQDKISDLFTNLDNLITLHQRKLEKLKNIKKSMLDKMFV